MTIALVDDQALSAVLRGSRPQALRGFDLATTGCWYVRLCQAVLGAADRAAVLSRPFAELPDGLQTRVTVALLELPEDIALLGLRDLASDMGRLRQRHTLNVLGMEALAAALRLSAEVMLSTPAPRLEAALAAEQRPCRFLG